MGTARGLGGVAAAAAWLAATVPGAALAQAPALPEPVPPGGLSDAWPLGVIVALVALSFVAGAWLARRRGAAAGGRRGT